MRAGLEAPLRVQVDLPGEEFSRGWIRGTRANIIEGNQLTVLSRLDAMEQKTWPAAVKQDILHGRVRIGFTKEQVEIAHAIDPSNKGRPDAKLSEETAAGVIETWKYGDVVYAFKNGRVAKVTRIE